VRVARFKIRTHLDGKRESTVAFTENAGGEDFTIGVRPLGSRLEYTGLLSTIAGIVVEKAQRVEADEEFVPADSRDEGRVARFRVLGVTIDKATVEATVLVKMNAEGTGSFTVRALRSRDTYTRPLSDVALIVAALHAKFMAQAKGISVPRPRRGTGRL
jgi:hypothetical protein